MPVHCTLKSVFAWKAADSSSHDNTLLSADMFGSGLRAHSVSDEGAAPPCGIPFAGGVVFHSHCACDPVPGLVPVGPRRLLLQSAFGDACGKVFRLSREFGRQLLSRQGCLWADSGWHS